MPPVQSSGPGTAAEEVDQSQQNHEGSAQALGEGDGPRAWVGEPKWQGSKEGLGSERSGRGMSKGLCQQRSSCGLSGRRMDHSCGQSSFLAGMCLPV